jgi:ubiquinone biosynthesis protein UbiJ
VTAAQLQQTAIIVGSLSVILGGLLGLIKAAMWVTQQLRKIGRLADDLLGEPAHGGKPATPGLMERVATMEDHVAPLPSRLDALDRAVADLRADVAENREEVGDVRRRVSVVEAELKPNGGSTVRDAVDRIDAAVERLSAD